MKGRIYLTVALLLSLLIIVSCRKNHYRVSLSNSGTKIGIERLEKDIFSISPDTIPASLPSLRKKYGSFLQLFSFAINTGDINDPSFGDFLVRFCTDKLNYQVYEDVMRKYPNINQLTKDLSEAFRYYHHYFPEKNIPGVYTCISGFNYSIFTSDSIIGIGLERYLGSSNDYYKRLQIYRYLAVRMNPENIVPDAMYGWGSREWDFTALKYPADNVMTEMIHYGKLRYFEKCMLPKLNDSLIFGFTAAQMKFCRHNEGQMWQYIIEHNLLFSTDRFVIKKLTDEAPFTSYFTSESPGKAAIWTGFRIVESYMMKNSDVSLVQLMEETDVQKILEKAKYAPH